MAERSVSAAVWTGHADVNANPWRTAFLLTIDHDGFPAGTWLLDHGPAPPTSAE